VVRLEPRAVFDGRLYFCDHLTPELVWRPEWQAHPNGALALTRIALAASNPSVIADYFDRLFGFGVVARAVSTDVPDVLRAERLNVEIWSEDALARTLGVAMPERAGRADHMVLLGIKISSLSRMLKLLRRRGIPHERTAADRLLVSPSAAMNVALEFAE
jgi:hypothetical protein